MFVSFFAFYPSNRKVSDTSKFLSSFDLKKPRIPPSRRVKYLVTLAAQQLSLALFPACLSASNVASIYLYSTMSIAYRRHLKELMKFRIYSEK